MYLHILFPWPVSSGDSRMNNSSNLDLLFKVAFPICPFSFSLLWVLCSWLMNSWILCSDSLYCQVCEATCDLNSTHVRFALFPAVCIVQKELWYEVCLSAKSTAFYQLQMPTHPPARGWFCLSAVSVLWFFWGVNPALVSAVVHPVMFPDQFSSSLGAVNQVSSFHCEWWCVLGSVETLTNASVRAAPFTAFPDGSLGLVCVLDECSASSFLANIASTHWRLHLDLISPGYWWGWCESQWQSSGEAQT